MRDLLKSLREALVLRKIFFNIDIPFWISIRNYDAIYFHQKSRNIWRDKIKKRVGDLKKLIAINVDLEKLTFMYRSEVLLS